MANSWRSIFVSGLVLVLSLAVSTHITLASQATTKEVPLWWVLMGEAIGESDEGLYAVACVLRNRGYSPVGFDAAKRPDLARFVGQHSREEQQRAIDCLEKVRRGGVDITRGSNLYHGQSVRPYWARHPSVTHTMTIGEHLFYREERK